MANYFELFSRDSILPEFISVHIPQFGPRICQFKVACPQCGCFQQNYIHTLSVESVEAARNQWAADAQSSAFAAKGPCINCLPSRKHSILQVACQFYAIFRIQFIWISRLVPPPTTHRGKSIHLANAPKTICWIFFRWLDLRWIGCCRYAARCRLRARQVTIGKWPITFHSRAYI